MRRQLLAGADNGYLSAEFAQTVKGVGSHVAGLALTLDLRGASCCLLTGG